MERRQGRKRKRKVGVSVKMRSGATPRGRWKVARGDEKLSRGNEKGQHRKGAQRTAAAMAAARHGAGVDAGTNRTQGDRTERTEG